MNQVPLPARAASASLVASLAMLAHGALGMFGLAAWLRTPNIVSWRLLVALVATLASVGLSAWLWIAPSRKLAIAGLLVLIASLLRLGMPDEWGSLSYGVVAITAVLALPLLRALFALE